MIDIAIYVLALIMYLEGALVLFAASALMSTSQAKTVLAAILWPLSLPFLLFKGYREVYPKVAPMIEMMKIFQETPSYDLISAEEEEKKPDSKGDNEALQQER
jgi:hypothetical protein